MVPPAAQESPENDLPRNFYFGAEDRRLDGPAGLTDKHLSVERVRRYQLAEHLKNAANGVIRSISSLKDFDQTGHTDQALDHVVERLADVAKLGRNLVRDIEDAIDRYGDELDAREESDANEGAATKTPAAAADAPQVTAAAGSTPATTSTTPQQLVVAGPTPAGLAVVTPLTVAKNLDAALDRAAQLKFAVVR